MEDEGGVQRDVSLDRLLGEVESALGKTGAAGGEVSSPLSPGTLDALLDGSGTLDLSDLLKPRSHEDEFAEIFGDERPPAPAPEQPAAPATAQEPQPALTAGKDGEPAGGWQSLGA